MSTAFLPRIQPREEVAWQTMEEGISFLNTAVSPRRQSKPHNDSPSMQGADVDDDHREHGCDGCCITE
jgi:hypothetical protein